MHRHTLAIAALVLGCAQSHGPTRAPDGVGFCCPVALASEFNGCTPSFGTEPALGGGWAATAGECTFRLRFGSSPWLPTTDSHGCATWTQSGTCTCDPRIPGPMCCECAPLPDAGRIVDAGTATECSALSPAQCFGSSTCAPLFDDECCPTCHPGACGDCSNFTWQGCVRRAESACGTAGCGYTPSWGCGPAAPDCSRASPTDFDSCTAPGCVPAYQSGTGEPIMGPGPCVPITANSCTALCNEPPPPCPTTTIAEANDGCWTGQCIPAFVCPERL